MKKEGKERRKKGEPGTFIRCLPRHALGSRAYWGLRGTVMVGIIGLHGDDGLSCDDSGAWRAANLDNRRLKVPENV
jgi:hypothetical protein